MRFNDLINLSVKTNKQLDLDVSIQIEVDGQVWRCYNAIVSNRDILMICDKGTATYLVDSYGDKHVAELFDWNT